MTTRRHRRSLSTAAYWIETIGDMIRLHFGNGTVGAGVGFRDFISRSEYKAWAQKDEVGMFPRL